MSRKPRINDLLEDRAQFQSRFKTDPKMGGLIDKVDNMVQAQVCLKNGYGKQNRIMVNSRLQTRPKKTHQYAQMLRCDVLLKIRQNKTRQLTIYKNANDPMCFMLIPRMQSNIDSGLIFPYFSICSMFWLCWVCRV